MKLPLKKNFHCENINYFVLDINIPDPGNVASFSSLDKIFRKEIFTTSIVKAHWRAQPKYALDSKFLKI